MRLRRALAGIVAVASIAGCGDEKGFPLALSPQVPATIDPTSPTQLVADIGSNVDSSLRVRILDSNKYPVNGVTVHFRVVSGGGSIGDSTAVTGYSGIAESYGWKVGAEPGTNTLTASVGDLSTTFYALGVDPTVKSSSHYELVSVNGKPMPYSSPWNDFDSIKLPEGSIETFDGYYVRGWTVVTFFGDESNSTLRGRMIISGNHIELGPMNGSGEFRGDSLFVTKDMLPDGTAGSFIYVKNPGA